MSTAAIALERRSGPIGGRVIDLGPISELAERERGVAGRRPRWLLVGLAAAGLVAATLLSQRPAPSDDRPVIRPAAPPVEIRLTLPAIRLEILPAVHAAVGCK